MDITTLSAAIKSHADVLTALRDITDEIAATRLAGETVSDELIARADAAFRAEIAAEHYRNAAIVAAKEDGIPQAQNMYVPQARSTATLAREYKPIARAGGKLVF